MALGQIGSFGGYFNQFSAHFLLEIVHWLIQTKAHCDRFISCDLQSKIVSGVRFGPKLGQIGLYETNLGKFLRSISSPFWLNEQNEMNNQRVKIKNLSYFINKFLKKIFIPLLSEIFDNNIEEEQEMAL